MWPKPAKKHPPVEIGQRFRDRDKRMPRTVRVKELIGKYEVLVENEQTGRTTKMKASALHFRFEAVVV